MSSNRNTSREWEHNLGMFDGPDVELPPNYFDYPDLYDFVRWGNELTRTDDIEAKLAIEGVTLHLEPLDITE